MTCWASAIELWMTVLLFENQTRRTKGHYKAYTCWVIYKRCCRLFSLNLLQVCLYMWIQQIWNVSVATVSFKLVATFKNVTKAQIEKKYFVPTVSIYVFCLKWLHQHVFTHPIHIMCAAYTAILCMTSVAVRSVFYVFHNKYIYLIQLLVLSIPSCLSKFSRLFIKQIFLQDMVCTATGPSSLCASSSAFRTCTAK